MYDALKTSYGFQNVLKNENASEDGGFSHMYALHCFTHIKNVNDSFMNCENDIHLFMNLYVYLYGV